MSGRTDVDSYFPISFRGIPRWKRGRDECRRLCSMNSSPLCIAPVRFLFRSGSHENPMKWLYGDVCVRNCPQTYSKKCLGTDTQRGTLTFYVMSCLHLIAVLWG